MRNSKITVAVATLTLLTTIYGDNERFTIAQNVPMSDEASIIYNSPSGGGLSESRSNYTVDAEASVAQDKRNYAQYRKDIIDYVSEHGLSDDMWRCLQTKYGLKHRAAIKRLLLGCRHRYVVLSSDNDPRVQRLNGVAPLSGDPAIFGLERLTTWSLYILDNRSRRSKANRDRRPRYPVYRVLSEQMRVEILADAMNHAFERWLMTYRSLVQTIDSNTPLDCDNIVLSSPYDRLLAHCVVQRWNRTESAMRTASWCRYDEDASKRRSVADVDIGMTTVLSSSAARPASFNTLGVTSADGRSIRLNSLAKWYVRLNDIGDSLLRETVEAVIREMHEFYHCNESSARFNNNSSLYLDNPFLSDDWQYRSAIGKTIDGDKDAVLHKKHPGDVYSLSGVVLAELGNYFGFEKTERPYPVGLKAIHLDNDYRGGLDDPFPSYTRLNVSYRRTIDDLFGFVNNWQTVLFNAARIAMPRFSNSHDVTTNSRVQTLFRDLYDIRVLIERANVLTRRLIAGGVVEQ